MVLSVSTVCTIRMKVPDAESRLEKECACVLQAEAAATGIGSRPKSISHEVAQFTYNETGTEEAGAFEMSPFASHITSTSKSPID